MTIIQKLNQKKKIGSWYDIIIKQKYYNAQ